MDLSSRLRQLGAEGASGRLDVAGRPGGRVYFEAGAVACVEQHAQPTLVLAMAHAGLFTPGAWEAAVQARGPARWAALTAGDEGRRDRLIAFAAEHNRRQLEGILGGSVSSATFAPGAAHSFGPLATWTVADLLGSAADTPVIDRSEFLELLSEISPHVRPGALPRSPC